MVLILVFTPILCYTVIMNIFVTDTCPIKSARYLDNTRVIKMILESTQLLSNALHILNLPAPYKMTHINHPCSVWVRTSAANYKWTLRHLISLCREYTRRYGKIHKCQQYVTLFYKYRNRPPQLPFSGFVNCAANKDRGVSFKHIQDVPTAYRLYLDCRFKADRLAFSNL